ncbi:hypothetical protein EJ110_NYTH35117 [Nymphaea thermarum]|nr:hypothetical protein EJ110_NYTH35117 [Nymphaea thermarum]
MLISLAIWWGFGEIERLDLLRSERRLLHSLSRQWQRNLCRLYILSNFGFAEPSLFVTVVLLLRGSLQKRDSGTLSRQWNARTIAHLVILFVGPIFVNMEGSGPSGNGSKKIPVYFTQAYTIEKDESGPIFCTYPLLSTVLHGLFASLLIGYLFYLGAKMVSLVINGGLQKRIYYLLFSVVGLLPIRILFLGFTVLSKPGELPYEVLEFLSFLALLCCTAVAIGILVYFPVADSLELRGWNIESGTRGGGTATRPASLVVSDLDDDNASLIANQSVVELVSSGGRNSDDESTRGGSISFRTMLKDGQSGEHEDVNLFYGSALRLPSPPESPALPGWPRAPVRDAHHSSARDASN